MYIDEQIIQLPTEPVAPPAERAEPGPRGPRPWVGALAVALALAAGILQIVAVTTASRGDFEAGIVVGYLAIVVAVAAVGAGIAAIIVGRGRRAGIVGIVLGIVANPLLLLGILRIGGGTQG